MSEAVNDRSRRLATDTFKLKVSIWRICDSVYTSDRTLWAGPTNGILKYSRKACSDAPEGRSDPADFMNSRARGSVSMNRQFGGTSVLQRLNSLIKKGTSKDRPLWATHKMSPPGFWRLSTYCSKIGIKSFHLHENHKERRNEILHEW